MFKLGVWSAAALLGSLSGLIMARPASAVDGVIEINQTSALAGGITLNDLPGFPVTISQPGSYRLTGNLDIRSQSDPQNLTVIDVSSDDVTIDLNGFAIRGPVSCTGQPVVCAGTGTGNGINSGLLTRNVAVLNGTIRGMGQHGIKLDRNARVENMRLTSNGGQGAQLDQGAVVRNNSIDRNGTFGLQVAGGSVVTGNTISFNSTLLSSGGVNGIGGVTILGNSVFDNRGLALNLDPNGGYGENVLVGNNGGANNPQVAGGLQIGTNVCGTDTVCP